MAFPCPNSTTSSDWWRHWYFGNHYNDVIVVDRLSSVDALNTGIKPYFFVNRFSVICHRKFSHLQSISSSSAIELKYFCRHSCVHDVKFIAFNHSHMTTYQWYISHEVVCAQKNRATPYTTQLQRDQFSTPINYRSLQQYNNAFLSLPPNLTSRQHQPYSSSFRSFQLSVMTKNSTENVWSIKHRNAKSVIDFWPTTNS